MRLRISAVAGLTLLQLFLVRGSDGKLRSNAEHVDEERKLATSSSPSATPLTKRTYDNSSRTVPLDVSGAASSNLPSVSPAISAPASAPSIALVNKPINLLIITADQMRYDAMQFVQSQMSVYDNAFKIRTPNLDRLAGGGVYFSAAYAQGTFCAPSRSTMRTGCTLERTGIHSNHADMVRSYHRLDGDEMDCFPMLT
jgi:hypothetical protein